MTNDDFKRERSMKRMLEQNSYSRQIADGSGTTDAPKLVGAGQVGGLLAVLFVALGGVGFWLISDKVNKPDLPNLAIDNAIAQREQVRARNDAKKRQYQKELEVFKKRKAAYEKELKAFKKAKMEYTSLHSLDFAGRFDTEAARTERYQDIVRAFPGTDAAIEAQRRLTGGAPKSLAVPPEPFAPTRPPRAPKQPEYEPEL